MRLTDAERAEVEAILLASDWPVEDCEEIAETITPAIERVIAARLDRQRETLAASIERRKDDFPNGTYRATSGVAAAFYDDAARIVREDQPGEGT